MAEFQLDPKTIDYDALPPLVPKGVDPEAVLGPLVEAWARPLQDDNGGNTNASPGVTLDRVALVDGNTGEPIDLGGLIARVGERAAGGAPPDGLVPGLVMTLRGCSIPTTNADGRTLRCRLITTTCHFGTTDFNEAVFGGDAWFDRASFGSQARFGGTSFGGVAWFMEASFGGSPRFGGASFGGDVHFEWASVVGVAGFDGASFGRQAGFGGASFGGDARFEGAIFGRHAGFNQASFGGDAWFEGAAFVGVAWFDLASFGGDVVFRGDMFVGQPRFARARFSDQQFFLADAAFATAIFQTDSRDTASFGRPAPARDAPSGGPRWRRPIAWFLQGLARARWRAWSRGDAYRLRWDVVRGFGELAILTRVSMSALVLVPILAALWPAVRGTVGRLGQPYGVLPPMMPWAWAALFFAAVLVVIGRVLYQAHAPQEVREASRVDFIARHAEAFREASDVEHVQLLREAIEAVDEAGSDAVLRWFRHRRLVRHHGRVVWIPERIEDFEYEPTELPTPEPSASPGATHHEDHENDQHDTASQTGMKPKPRYSADPVMPPESRKMIAVRAGADARYDLIARQNRQWARFALWCYTLAVVLVVIVLWDQSVAVLRETGMAKPSDILRWALPALALLALAAIALWIVWDAWMGWLRWPWLARQWERLKEARGSFTPIDEMQAEIQRRLGETGRPN